MKQYLIALSLAYGLTSCEYEDGKDGADGTNGMDGQGCEIVNDGQLQCGDDVIAIRGEKDEPGRKGEDGENCRIETKQDGDFLVCGDQSVRIPPEISEQGACTSERLENGNHLITCNGDTIEVPGLESISEIFEIAMTPVELVASSVSVYGNTATSTLEFNVPVTLNQNRLTQLESIFTKFGPKSVQITSKIGESNYSDWALSLPGSLFQNSYYSASVATNDIELTIYEYGYIENLETLLFTSNLNSICDDSFSLNTFEDAKERGTREHPLLLSLLERKAYDTESEKVISLESSEDVEVICLR
ncbi:MAG: hypothetical protein HRU19_04705 [Pseudobacteriovorax sp.]|nr:hypothetical protein [Pseudobacteriovorax sp.]